MTERNATGNGYDWVAIYDPMGRRLQTVYTPVVNAVAQTAQIKQTKSYFDPEVAYLELGVRRWGGDLPDETWWKLYTIDSSGGYGSLMGVGGLDSICKEDASGLLSVDRTVQITDDSMGNLTGYAQKVNGSWTYSRTTTLISAYGPANVGAAKAAAWSVTASANFVESSVWHGYRIDPTGFIWMGARYYDPQGGRFISPDPLGHSASMDLYSFASGDPINYLDPTGETDLEVILALTPDYVGNPDPAYVQAFVEGGISPYVDTASAIHDFSQGGPGTLTITAGAVLAGGVVIERSTSGDLSVQAVAIGTGLGFNTTFTADVSQPSADTQVTTGFTFSGTAGLVDVGVSYMISGSTNGNFSAELGGSASLTLAKVVTYDVISGSVAASDVFGNPDVSGDVDSGNVSVSAGFGYGIFGLAWWSVDPADVVDPSVSVNPTQSGGGCGY
jgi:RHS repeat-associated protein